MSKIRILLKNQSNNEIVHHDDKIFVLPENTEYSIIIYNNDSRDAIVKVSIDDDNKTVGGVIVDGYNMMEIKGPINSGKNFKVIKTDAAVVMGKNIDFSGIINVFYGFRKYVLPLEEMYRIRGTTLNAKSMMNYGHTIEGGLSGQDWNRVSGFQTEDSDNQVYRLKCKSITPTEDFTCLQCGYANAFLSNTNIAVRRICARCSHDFNADSPADQLRRKQSVNHGSYGNL